MAARQRHLRQGKLGSAHPAQPDRRQGLFRRHAPHRLWPPDPKPGNFGPRFGSTKEYIQIVKDVTGIDYQWFFDVYLYQAALPELVETRQGDTLTLEWKAPSGKPFPLPVEVDVDGAHHLTPVRYRRRHTRPSVACIGVGSAVANDRDWPGKYAWQRQAGHHRQRIMLALALPPLSVVAAR